MPEGVVDLKMSVMRMKAVSTQPPK